MEYISDEILIQAIERQGEIFDSHDVTFTIMRDLAEAYTRDLHAALDSSQDPFVKLHTDITKRMASSRLSHIVEKHGGKQRSMNCRGKMDECQVWRRII
jgi:GTP:adenosylcobinamide-phosphate guanylyltransferase